jgi:ATP-dependent RNA helicase RhlE
MTFLSLKLNPFLLKNIANQGYKTPSLIQEKAIPKILEGHDILAAAQTGTGKTAGFTLPILHQLLEKKPITANQTYCLILTPTRELAIQVNDNIVDYSINLPISSMAVYGGVKINPQMMKLRKGVSILVATPGRLLDLYNKKAIHFNQINFLVLDEADRMLDMGFIHDIKKIIGFLPKKRQNLLFSATFSDEIRAFAKKLMHHPIEIAVAPKNTVVKSIKQWVYPVDKKQKSNLLSFLIGQQRWTQVLVFTRTKHGANRLCNIY